MVMARHTKPYADEPEIEVGQECSQIRWPIGTARKQAFIHICALHIRLEERYTDQLMIFREILWTWLVENHMNACLRETDISGMVERAYSCTKPIDIEIDPSFKDGLADIKEHTRLVDCMYRGINENIVDVHRFEQYLALVVPDDDKLREAICAWVRMISDTEETTAPVKHGNYEGPPVAKGDRMNRGRYRHHKRD